MWLAVAYATRSLLPAASTLPVPSSFVTYHAASVLWYAARANRVYMSSAKRVAWTTKTQSQSVLSQDMSVSELCVYAASGVLQFPLYCPSAAMFPFAACCLLGMESTINSNVMLMVQMLALCVALVFDSALLLPLYTTTVALLGFGMMAPRATPIAFLALSLSHAIFAVVGGIVWSQGFGVAVRRSSLHNADVLTACFAAVLCAEARLRAATTVVNVKRRVMWACRAASVGSVCTCVFRVVAERETNTPHVSSTAIALLVLCSVWNWGAHVEWRNAAVFPPRPVAQKLTGLAVSFVLVTVASSFLSLRTLSTK